MNAWNGPFYIFFLNIFFFITKQMKICNSAFNSHNIYFITDIFYTQTFHFHIHQQMID